MTRIKIWNREFDIKIVYDCFDYEQVTENQKSAISAFLPQAEMLLAEVYPKLCEYCINRNGEQIGADQIDNIFKYVIPTQLFVKRTKGNERIVALMCEYKFDPDHGIAIVFENNKLKEIGPQDIIL